MPHSVESSLMAERFRGYLPVVIDVETGGFNAATDALLEVSAATLAMDDEGVLSIDSLHEYRVKPFAGANIEQSALDFTGIDIDDPDRDDMSEEEVLSDLFRIIRKAIKRNDCSRAIMVAHNAHFDLGFINAAAQRCDIKRNPFHPFSCMDTATLSGLAFGHTVLAQACQLAKIGFSNKEAHAALYDTRKTAELFCLIVNRWQTLGGWPLR